ncbi:hypothetical protein BIFADO_02281 [Bifidobacterium adolescentis L2-32]|uniref:Uncharacterized protein n=1 Tax=Bifidobacterium adolescentis L2-32 TaxID=411481 RepID=A7A8T9_BIFAD|nr:hypothetical protein BIFADO_02281 [Bifidobacterium adolescentis L2-32]
MLFWLAPARISAAVPKSEHGFKIAYGNCFVKRLTSIV